MSIDTATKEFITSKSILSKDEISRFLKNSFPGISRETIDWRIHRMLQISALRRTGRGIYTSSPRKNYEFAVTDKMMQISGLLKDIFPELVYSIWDTSVMNDFSIHQSARYTVILEVERGTEASVFNLLSDKVEDVFLSPTEREYQLYVSNKYYPLIIRPLISQSPKFDRSGVSIPKLEKILVDIFVDDPIFSAFQGNELVTIFRNAIEIYTINFNMLFRYAGRRGARKKLKKFLDVCDINIPGEI